MVGLSCSGIECAPFGVVQVLVVLFVGAWAIPAGLTAARLVRRLAVSTGWARWDAPVRVAAFLGGAALGTPSSDFESAPLGRRPVTPIIYVM